MRNRKLVVAMVSMAAVAWPGFGRSRPAAVTVPVYMDYQGGGDLRAVNQSMAIASKMFRTIGVTLIWVDSRSCPPEGLHISLTGHTPATLQPGALAYALPYEGTHIRVFRDRIEANKPALVPHLLAHVMVHEIIHMLQGCTRHSDRGLMKAHWDDVDLAQMQWIELPIAQEDIDLVHLGIEKRAPLAAAHTDQDSLAHNLAATLVAPVQPE
jgi:hypothetical protein